MEGKLKSIKNIFMVFLLAIITFLPLNTIDAYASEDLNSLNITVDSNGNMTMTGGGMTIEDSGSAWTQFLSKYKGFIVGVSGIGAISMIAFFIYNFMKLGAVSTNPSERAKVLQGLIWSGIASAGLGSVSIIVGFFYGALK